jgi:hypothetical protein
MKRKYNLTFEFFDTFEQAYKFKDIILNRANDYYKQKIAKKISILPWESHDKTEHKIIMWYYA